MTMNVLQAALRYRELGWSVIPMKTGRDPLTGEDEKKVPCVKWKKYQTELPSESDLRYWFGKKWPNANIALVCGGISKVFAIDFDSREALEHYKAVYDTDVEATICQVTGRDGGGLHALFHTMAQRIPLIQPVLKKTDLKGDGSYIIVEPSIHETGRLYQWGRLNPLTDGIDDLMDPPSGFFQMLKDYEEEQKGKATRRASPKNDTLVNKLPKGEPSTEIPRNPEGWEHDVLMGVTEGERDVAAAKLAGLYLSKDYEQRDTLSLLQGWNANNVPPLDEKDIKKVVDSIYGNHAKVVAQKISEVVEKITILRYPDGKNRYQMHLGYGRSTLLSMEDLMSSRRTTVKIADTTKAVFCPSKQMKWLSMVQSWLNTAEEKKISVEESELGIIKEILGGWLIQWHKQKRSEHLNLASMVNNSCVVEDGVIYFTLTHLEEDLRFRNVKLTRTLLCEFLRRLGGEVTEPRKRFDKSRIRTWDIKEETCE